MRELKKSGTTRTEVLDSLGQPDEVREENFGQDIWHYDDVIVDGFGLGTSFGPRTVELRFRNDKVIPCPYLKWLFLKGLDIIFFPIFAFLRIMPFKDFIAVPTLFFSLVGFMGMKGMKEFKWRLFFGYCTLGCSIFIYLTWFHIFIQVMGTPK